ncbi:MAG: OB-fold domain-containing protein [Desulfobacteraceae bacterium]|nr:OB-fold domain-containing protein [Desulfobacteraceae bacterium]
MAGIISVGVHIPVYRMPRALIAENWETGALPGEKAVANHDEDSLTMGVAAARRCLKEIDLNQVDALYFATTTAPYTEKQSAALMAAVLQLPEDTQTLDFCNSLRSGTGAVGAALNAINSGALNNVLVCASDLRLFRPKSNFEMFCGDGAAAFLLGKEDTIAEIEFFDSFYDEIQDIWRSDKHRFLRTAEDRFVQDLGYYRVVRNAVANTLKKHELKAGDFSKVCTNFSNAKTIGRLFSEFGFRPEEQLQNDLHNGVGDTGAAMAMMNAVDALENAEPRQRILVSGYGSGCDNICIRTTKRIKDFSSDKTLKDQLKDKIPLNNYNRYLIWRELIEVQKLPRPPLEERQPTPQAQWRETKGELALCGTRCLECGTPQYPPQRVCMVCTAKDKFEKYSFSNKKAELRTYSHDYLSETLDPPITLSVVDFEGGGRVLCEMTDREIDQVRVGMNLEMTFRKLYYVGGIYNYWWKCKPADQNR